MKKVFVFLLLVSVFQLNAQRSIKNFNNGWQFYLGTDTTATAVNQKLNWQSINLPHDWSIELPFSEKAPATNQGGSLPGGIGWYKKIFSIASKQNQKLIYLQLDGVYRNSEVWINGHYLGKRPNGYISFEYQLNDYLKFGKEQNIIIVKVDNAQQPNSRWYSGSGIYRNTWLVSTDRISIKHWGSFVTTPTVTKKSATVLLHTSLLNQARKENLVKIVSIITNDNGVVVATNSQSVLIKNSDTAIEQKLTIPFPKLWSMDHPNLYKLTTTIFKGQQAIDNYSTSLGIRTFYFDAVEGFFLNGLPMKIKGVCMHQDLGALGVAINTSAIARQLTILKEMGCNAIRTAHNPPSTEFLNLCDQMGFLVMDEAFDMWAKKKNKFDYSADFNKWHRQDLADQILRDRNHPSVFIWSIGNEIREQFDSTGIAITKELVAIVKSIDTTRPITAGLSESNPEKNFMYKSGALDLVGLNYHTEVYKDFQTIYPNQKFIAAETMSALASRGHYDMPSDSIMYWPQKSPMKYVEGGNKDFTVSAYDQVAAYWGSTHEATWKIIKKYAFLSGLFVWTGFDYLGEPTPYPYPARSSYFGIVDLAGFPKDVYYMYQSEWTNKPVLHLFPHWNWTPGKMVDVWAYYNQADEVELFLNGYSLGIKKKALEDLHVMWRVKYEPGTLRAVSRKNGKIVLESQVVTAGVPARIELVSDKKIIHPNTNELCFVTVKILDKNGNIVPDASNSIHFSVNNNTEIKGVDNGSQTSLQPFKSNDCNAYNGLCLVILKAKNLQKNLELTAESVGLKSNAISIKLQ